MIASGTVSLSALTAEHSATFKTVAGAALLVPSSQLFYVTSAGIGAALYNTSNSAALLFIGYNSVNADAPGTFVGALLSGANTQFESTGEPICVIPANQYVQLLYNQIVAGVSVRAYIQGYFE